jgi:GNAT superfamily N-acetyltransferase
MTDAVVIRKLHPDDAVDWARLRFDALTLHPLAFGATAPESYELLIETAQARLAPSDDAAVFGAFVDGALVGICGIRRNDGVKERHKAFVWGMYVAATHRRSGAGARLLESAIEQARSWDGVRMVGLAVSELAPDAERLYVRMGFRRWGYEPKALCWNGTFVDEAHMVLDLAEAT